MYDATSRHGGDITLIIKLHEENKRLKKENAALKKALNDKTSGHHQ